MKSLQEYLITEANRYLKDLRAANKTFNKSKKELDKEIQELKKQRLELENEYLDKIGEKHDKEMQAELKEKYPEIYKHMWWDSFDYTDNDKEYNGVEFAHDKNKKDEIKKEEEVMQMLCDKYEKLFDEEYAKLKETTKWKELTGKIKELVSQYNLNKDNALDWLHNDILWLKEYMERAYKKEIVPYRKARKNLVEYFMLVAKSVEKDIDEMKKLTGEDLTNEANECCAKLKLSFLTFKNGKVQPIDIKNKDFANMWNAVKSKEKK